MGSKTEIERPLRLRGTSMRDVPAIVISLETRSKLEERRVRSDVGARFSRPD